jgi:hypothetical protein
LPEEERAYLWDLEHHGNLLSQYGFKAVTGALSKGDRSKVAALLSESFRGRLPEDVVETKREDDLLRVTRRTVAGDSFREVGRDPVVAELLSFRRTFAEPPRVHLAIKHLSPHVRGDLDSLWEGQCLLRMWGTSARGKPAEVELVLDFEVERPTCEQGGEGGWVRGLTLRQSQVARAERFLFREVTAERGIDTTPLHDNWKAKKLRSHTGGAYLCDFDRDGRLDVLLTDMQDGYLYRGLAGGKFREVASEVGLKFYPTRGGLPLVVWADLDGDRWEDLIHGQTVWRNDRGKRFVDQTECCQLPIPFGGISVAVADYDRDGRLDLYITHKAPGKADSWLSGKGGEGTSNRLFRNKGNWQFEDVTEKSGTGGGGLSTFAAAWLDANDDGWPDLHAINEFGDGVLLVSRIVRQVSGGPVHLYENTLPPRHYLMVSLRGVKSNRQGIGARLVAEAGGRKIVRELYPADTFRGQQASRVHFGLADAAHIDRLTIRWPSGETQVLHDVAPDRHVVITGRQY